MVRMIPDGLEWLRVSRWLCRAVFVVITRLFDEIAPLLPALLRERTVKRNIRALQSSGELGDEYADYAKLHKSDLIASHQIELRRRAALQQRVQFNAATIAVSASMITAALAFLGGNVVAATNGNAALLWLLRISFTCLVISLLMSGLGAIRAVGVRRQCDNYLQSRARRNDAEHEDESERIDYVRMILLNQGYNLIIAYHADASFKSMRNALLALAFMLLAVVWAP